MLPNTILRVSGTGRQCVCVGGGGLECVAAGGVGEGGGVSPTLRNVSGSWRVRGVYVYEGSYTNVTLSRHVLMCLG